MKYPRTWSHSPSCCLRAKETEISAYLLAWLEKDFTVYCFSAFVRLRRKEQ